jgi:hypothetical protein
LPSPWGNLGVILDDKTALIGAACYAVPSAGLIERD